MDDISEETHEFRQGQVSSLFPAVRYLLQSENSINDKRLSKLVKDKIHQKRKFTDTNVLNVMDKNNQVIEKPCDQMSKTQTIDNGKKLEALASLCRVIFSVIFVTKNGQVTTSVYARYYSGNYLSLQQCVYMIYNETCKHYAPLYVLNKTDSDKQTTILDFRNKIINTLLRKFFKEHLHYDKDVHLDDQTESMTNEIQPRIQNTFDNMSDIIAANTGENVLEKKITTNSDAVFIVGDQVTSNVKTNLSDITYEFRCEDVPRDSSCLYWSFIHIFGQFEMMDAEHLRSQVADCIFSMNIDDATLLHNTGCQTRSQYCDKIRKDAWGGKFELLTLTEIYRIVTGVVSMFSNEQGELSVDVINYGDDNRSFTDCVYMIHNIITNHYQPLYLCDKDDPSKCQTVFNRCDSMVNTLLNEFVRKQRYQFVDANTSHENDISDKLVDVPESITSYPNTNIIQEPEIPFCCPSNMKFKQQPSERKTIITEETHEFRIGELPGDDRCLFSSVIHLFDRSQTISIRTLRKKVANYIRHSKSIGNIFLLNNTNGQTLEAYCLNIEEGIILAGEAERHALAYLYPHILFCIISYTNNSNAPPVYIDIYVKDSSSYKKCIIILYDMVDNKYVPLYLYDKVNCEEENTGFKYDDGMKRLLEEFIQKTLRYHDYINFDVGNSLDEVDSDDCVEPESVDVFGKIAFNVTSGTPKTSTSDERKKHDKILSSDTSNHGYVKRPKFYQKLIDPDGHCLFSSLCFLLLGLKKWNVKSLRKEVADIILRSDNIDDEVLLSETRQTRQQYCNKMKNTNAEGGEIEIRAAAGLSGVTICVLNPNNDGSTVSSVRVNEYPENESSFEKCVYIRYVRKNHYEPLYLIDGNNSNKITTIFNRKDTMTKEALCEFICQEFNFGEYECTEPIDKNNGAGLKFECHAKVVSQKETNSINEPTKKRKAPDDAENPLTADTRKKSSLSTLSPDQADIQPPTSFRPIPATDQSYVHQKKNESSDSIEQLLQMDAFHTPISSIVNLLVQQREGGSSSILSPNTTVSHHAQNEQMRFETDLIPGFRGRFLSEYQPKKENKKNGKKSKPNKPSYFPDSANRHSLNLLIPEAFLFGDLGRVRVDLRIVTRTINGCIYIHPYFQFYDVRRNRTSVTANPLSIDLGSDDEMHKLKKKSEGVYNLILYLPVIMLKEDELLRNQPIQLFQSSISSDQNIPIFYQHCDAYKKDFHLNDLRFVATLWIKNNDDNGSYRCTDIQCISGISTQDKDFKVSTAFRS